LAAEQITPIVDSDEDLVVRARNGDAEAFEELYERFFKRVYHFVDRRIRNSADTEETVQEAFINIFKSIESYRGDSPFSAWVFGVTRRTIAGRFKRKRHPTVPLMDEDLELSDRQAPGGQPSPVELYECQELLADLENKLATRLSDEQRQLFDLHHLQDRPISEIAATLDKSENAVKSNLYRTRKILLAR
jgi:RNA polymerase sigma-70 factor (ECF subfamily)